MQRFQLTIPGLASSVTGLWHLAFLIATAALSGDACSSELIWNGSFEVRDGIGTGPHREGWDDGPGVENDVGFALGRYEVDEINERLLRPNGAGSFYGQRWGLWNGTGFSGSATQVIDAKDSASRPFEFSAWLASRDQAVDRDYATVMLEFFDEPNATGQSLGMVLFDGDDQSSPYIVGSLNDDGLADPSIPATQDNWTYYQAKGIIPPLASSASVVIRGNVPPGVPGNGVDGYVDLVSLRVIPEPASVVLLLMSVVAGVICYRRRRFS